MTSARAIVMALAAGAAVLHGEAQGPPAGQPAQTFRTGTDVVFADVSVRAGGRAVTGLRAEDFVLTDNGVRQRIESVEASAVPIDLTLVVDLSGNPRSPLMRRTPLSKVVMEIQAEVNDVTRMLRADDRVRVFAVDRDIQLVSPLSPVSALAPVGRVAFGGLAALYDTLAAALLQPVEPARRHVVIARTRGRDTISSIDARAVQAIAAQSDALFHLAMMESAEDNDAALTGFQCAFIGACWPTRRFWVPFERRLIGPGPVHQLLPDGQAFDAATETTGGALHKASGFSVPTLTGTFKQAFEDFRSSYVLRYTPQGVSRGGWHAIEVRVPGSRAYDVRSRKGYGVEETTPTPAKPAVPGAPRTLAELADAYQRGAYQQVMVALRQASEPVRLIRDFEEAGNPWPATPRREAAFALELAEAGVFAARAETREHALKLIERFTRLVRHPIEPDVFERYWHFAALTLLEGSTRLGAAEVFVNRALERFPDEPRFVLSRAITTDQRWSARRLGPAAGAAGASPAPDAETVGRNYDAAVALPETAVEARIRLAWFLHRTGKHDEALVHLTAAGARPVTDPALAYLRHLFLGHVLGALERQEEAVAAFRAALTVVPAAQSPRVALMNAMIMRGDRSAAETMAEQIQTQAGLEIDPWWVYWQGQYRLHPLAMARVRELSR